MKRIAVAVFMTSVSSAAAFSACGGDDDARPTVDSGTAGDVTTESSSSSSSGGTGDGGVAGCAAYATALCNRQARCKPLFVDMVYGNLAACVEGFTMLCERTTRAPGAGAAPLSTSCIDALDTGCGDVDPALVACIGKGSLADDSPCEFDGQCTSGRCASAGGTAGCGLCKAATDASTSFGTARGGSCDNEGDCAQGLSCIDAGSVGPTPTMGTCETTRALGEACSGAEDCNTGYHGDLGWMGFTVACLDGGCAKPLDESASCPSPLGNAHTCDLQKKLRCDLGSGTCTKVAFASANEPCTTNSQTPSGTCFGDLRCISAPDGGNAGTCTPKASIGGPCAKDYECRFGLECIEGSCTNLPADRCK